MQSKTKIYLKIREILFFVLIFICVDFIIFVTQIKVISQNPIVLIGFIIFVLIALTILCVFVSTNQLVKVTSKTGENKKIGNFEYAWNLSCVTLETYIDKNVDRITAMFQLSVAIMLIGFVIIFWGISQPIIVRAIYSEKQNITSFSDIFPHSLIASVIGVITEFVGLAFFFIYQSTLQQISNYSKILEHNNSIGIAMRILDSMTENQINDLNSLKVTLVELFAKQRTDEVIEKFNNTKEENNNNTT